MRKLSIFLGVLLLLGGFGLCGYAIAVNGFDFSSLNTATNYEIKNVTDNIAKNIDIYAYNASVTINKDGEEGIRVEYAESSLVHYAVEQGETLKLYDDTAFYVRFNNWDFNKYYITITLPSTFNGDIKIKSTNAEFKINNITCQSLDLHSTNGAFTIKDTQVEKKIAISTTNGAINLETVVSENIEVATTNGRFDFKYVNVSSDFTAKTTNGRITLQEIKVGTGYFKSTNGSIQGTLVGSASDYHIVSSTTNGKDIIPQTNGTNKVEFKSTNGDINISFA